MEDSRNGYDSVRPIDEEYIREFGSFSITRALIFLLEAPFSYLSVSGEKFKPGYLSVSGEKFKPGFSSPEKNLNLFSGEKFKPGYLFVSGERFKSLLRRKI